MNTKNRMAKFIGIFNFKIWFENSPQSFIANINNIILTRNLLSCANIKIYSFQELLHLETRHLEIFQTALKIYLLQAVLCQWNDYSLLLAILFLIEETDCLPKI